MSGRSPEWKDGRSKDITFIVTKDCQLACKYCYLVGKNADERMSWDTAKQAVDFILSHERDEEFDFESVVFNFIGGEPFLEIDLIDSICDYLKLQMYLSNHHWFNSYRFSITTNGINYDSPKVQNFIRKNLKHLSITITIDGTPQKHNLNRVWRDDGNNVQLKLGSYDAVVKNIPLWLEQFPDAATKVTVSSPDIPYIKESVLHLFNLGIHYVYINCVFENVWKDGDDALLEEQLRLLADEMIGHGLYKEYYCSFFDREIGKPIDAKNDRNWCGAGMMLAFDAHGNLYPCTRFVKYSLREKPARVIGHLDTGIDRNLLRPYHYLSRSIQSSKECFECEVASGCAWCQGENYDCSESGTIFRRSTAICRMHKARVRANEYYWNRLDDISNCEKAPLPKIDNKFSLDGTVTMPENVIVLLSTDATSFCIASNKNNKIHTLIPIDILRDVVNQASRQGRNMQFVYPEYKLPDEYLSLIATVQHKDIVPISYSGHGDAVVFNSWEDINGEISPDSFCILRTSLSNFYRRTTDLVSLLNNIHRLNIVFTDECIFSEQDVPKYREVISELSNIILNCWKAGKYVEVNLITDRLHLTEMDNCDAGWRSITLAPNGKYYICPSFYYANEEDSCGDVQNGLALKDALLYKLDYAPVCKSCNAYHCSRCVFLNKKRTLEVNIPSFEQCKKAEIELEATRQFYHLWKKIESI